MFFSFLIDFGWNYGTMVVLLTKNVLTFGQKHIQSLFLKKVYNCLLTGIGKKLRGREIDKQILCRGAVGQGFDPTQAGDCVSAEGCGHDLSTNLRHGFNFFNQPS